MSGVSKVALIPLVVLWLWALPRDQPNTDVAGALVVAAVDASVVADDATTSTEAATTSTEAATTTTATTQPIASTTSPTSVQTTTLGETSAPTPSTETLASSTTSTTPQTAQTVPEALANVPLGQQALNRMSFDWQTAFPTWTVEFTGPRDGLRALTHPLEHRVEIFVRNSDTAATLHRVLAHEIGHVIDVQFNTDSDRARWRQQRNLPTSAPWWPSASAPDFATGAGDFAEAFSAMEAGVASESSIGGQPTAGDFELLRELMRG